MQFIGFMVIMVVTGLAAFLANTTAGDPEFVTALAAYSSWAAEHSVTLGWVASGAICLAGIAIPPMLMKREFVDGRDRMAEIGEVTSSFALSYMLICGLLFLAIPGVGYLFGMGWFAAQKAAGL